ALAEAVHGLVRTQGSCLDAVRPLRLEVAGRERRADLRHRRDRDHRLDRGQRPHRHRRRPLDGEEGGPGPAIGPKVPLSLHFLNLGETSCLYGPPAWSDGRETRSTTGSTGWKRRDEQGSTGSKRKGARPNSVYVNS